MGKKLIMSAMAAMLIASGVVRAREIDSLVNKHARLVGPVYFDASPPVDSVLLHKQAIGKRLVRKDKESADLVKYNNLLMLHSLLNRTEISGEPREDLLPALKILLEDYKQMNDQRSQALILNTYGVHYGKKGNIPQAVYYFNEAYRLKETLKDRPGMVAIASNLAALYRMSGEYQKAINQNETVIALYRSMNKNHAVAETYLQLAENMLSISKHDDAEYYIIKKALPLFTRMGNKAGRMKCFQSLSGLYYQQKRYSEAKWFCIQTSALAEKLNDKQALIGSLIHIAEVKNALEDHEDALVDYKKAESLAIQNQYMISLVEIKGDMGETYNMMGNYSAAGTALDEYTKLHEKLVKGMVL